MEAYAIVPEPVHPSIIEVYASRVTGLSKPYPMPEPQPHRSVAVVKALTSISSNGVRECALELAERFNNHFCPCCVLMHWWVFKGGILYLCAHIKAE